MNQYSLSIIIPSNNEPNILKMLMEVERLFPEAQIVTCNDRDRRGKGWAVRMALKEATGDLICMIDGDGDIPAKMIKRLLPFIEDYDIVVGVKPISGIWQRRIITFLSRLYIALLFNIKISTQTGVKIFKKEAICNFYNNQWLFDLEMIALAKKKGFSFIEVPVEANVSKKIKLISLWNTFKESITLFLELNG